MFQFLAAAFTSVGMLVGGLFGHHAPMGPNASSTAMHGTSSSSPWMNGHTGSTTPWNNGSTTPGHMGMAMPGIFGTVASISGDTLTVVGHGGPNTATTTFTVDATNAKVFKGGAGMQGMGAGMMGSSTMPSADAISVSSIQVNDSVMVMGMVSGTNVTAKMIVDGVMPHMMGGGKPRPQPQGGSN